jgi:CBS domain-containing protein
MNLLKVGREPVSIAPTATVIDAVRRMEEANIGAIMILENDQLTGIFTERDLMLRVVLPGRDAQTTLVSEVMTSPVLTVRSDTDPDEVLRLMQERHIRHLPIVDETGRVQARISIRHLLREKVENLSQELDSLEAYLTADGIGG